MSGAKPQQIGARSTHKQIFDKEVHTPFAACASSDAKLFSYLWSKWLCSYV